MFDEVLVNALKQIFEMDENFKKRYIYPNKLHEYLNNNYSNKLLCIGYSFLGKPIYKISIGNGNKKTLIWSQMHGNETTGTLSCLDLLKFLHIKNIYSDKILNEFTLEIVFMLNPDGAERWTRENAVGIDMNRDFINFASIEMRILRDILQKGNYDLAFNLHDQRTIYGVGNTKKTTTLSFLSPSCYYNREVTESRKKAMGIINQIVKSLEPNIGEHIARYSDEFYPRSAGDNIQAMGIPTILFEGGHYPNDYYRQEVRKYFSYALIIALYYASVSDNWTLEYEDYFKIPENTISFYDIIYRNVAFSDNIDDKVDIGIMYEELIRENEEEIVFLAKIEEIGDLKDISAHLDIDAQDRKFSHAEKKYPKLGMIADFQLDEWFVVNGKKLLQI